MSATYERDAILYPTELDGHALVLIEDNGIGGLQFAAEPAAGRYYQHADADLHDLLSVDDDEHLGLWHALIDILNNGTGDAGELTGSAPENTYSVNVVTPPNSAGYVNGGLELRAVNATNPFQIVFSGSPATTIDPRWLGVKDPDQTASLSSVTDGADEVIVLPSALRGRLVTQTLSPTGRARDKHRVPYIDMRRSVPSPKDSRNVEWDRGHRRRMIYENVWGALVYERRPAEAAYASMARIDEDDHNVGWELLWRALMEGERVIVVHNSSDDLQVLTHSYEVGKLHSPSSEEMLGGFARVTGENGDLHSISFVLWVDQDFAGYDH